MENAAEFINGEESIRALIAARHAAGGASRKDTPKAHLSANKGLFGKRAEKGKPGASRELNLTPLNANLVEILHEVMAIPEARLPPPM